MLELSSNTTQCPAFYPLENYLPLDQFTAVDHTSNECPSAAVASEEDAVPKRCQANARERYRTHSVNSAFTHLRTMIPTEPIDRKLSKIETLRLAKSYIEHLNAVLATGRLVTPCSTHIISSGATAPTPLDASRRRPYICTFCVASKVILDSR